MMQNEAQIEFPKSRFATMRALVKHGEQRMDDNLDIPDFLKRTGDTPTSHAPHRRRVPKIKMPKAHKAKPWLPKTMEPEAWALLRQIEADKKRKMQARFAKLKERR